MRLANMAEPDYMPAGVTEDHKVRLGGVEFEVPVVNLDGFEEQSLATEEELHSFSHPKVRRQLAALEKITPQVMSERLAKRRAYWKRLESTEDDKMLKDLEEKGWKEYMKTELELGG